MAALDLCGLDGWKIVFNRVSQVSNELTISFPALSDLVTFFVFPFCRQESNKAEAAKDGEKSGKSAASGGEGDGQKADEKDGAGETEADVLAKEKTLNVRVRFLISFLCARFWTSGNGRLLRLF